MHCTRFAGLLTILCLLPALTVPAISQVRYYDEIFPEVTLTGSIQFGSAPSIYSSSEKLRLDLYQPTGDVEMLRPAIVFIHGGGWSGGQRNEMQPWCQTFARRGYVTVTIDYRTGIWKPTFAYTFEAGLRANQDVRAAVRWLRANAALYRIDARRIFLGGASAGSMAALLAAYLDDDEIPAGVDTVKWGNAEGRSGSPGFSSQVQGVLNYCGAILDTLYMDAGEAAVASFQGMADPLVPFGSAKSPDFGFVIHGSAPITRTAQRLGITTALAGIPDMGHGVPDQAMMDSLIRFERNFLYLLISTRVGVERLEQKQPNSLGLLQSYPNPFNAGTTIRYSLPRESEAALAVHAVDGRRIALLEQGRRSAGEHTVYWQAGELATGVYIVSLQADGLTLSRRVLLIK